ncbi:MAG: UDP-N-acetylmuramate--L-alanine ligase [Candidatus Paraimprobicoccus trichonymphae]|uniref:UDP-N-acetylmuramate--L-alanine ligase n=1 Tax=Candidatus Paraimprobicoccus trichonymphae TaxID=3033793 RepID=A0AA48IBR9_9FIRM|nr:MAG: UDP-N-acetylmuramate--L-alanine ligase [Candidatus Paraimprobicoccus trichonymphae]
MFALVRFLKYKNHIITGSDIYESDIISKIKDLNIKINLNHDKKNVENADLIVYSSAVDKKNVEILEAKRKNIPILTRCELLGIISKSYKNLVGVSGTHGKTTTTALIAHILLDSGVEPNAIIGGTLSRLNGNSCIGNSDILICEACEYKDSFLKLFPKISVITNLEPDHMDYFKNIDNLKKSFEKFMSQTKDLIIFNGDDLGTKNLISNIKDKEIISYGIYKDCNYLAKNITFDKNQYSSYDLFYKNNFIENISLKIHGKFNIYNSLAAIITCLKLDTDIKIIKKSVESFKGVHRRFEILKIFNNITIADDFAHHPTEIKSTLSSAKKMNFRKIWLIFQPHTFSRTKMFLNEFAESLSIADKVILTEILPVRETNIYNIYSKDLSKKIKNSVIINEFKKIADYVTKNAESGDLILTMGGGNIYKCANMISKSYVFLPEKSKEVTKFSSSVQIT